MYNITLSKKPDTKVTIYLSAVKTLKFPQHLFAGIGDKKKRYLAHLEKAFNEKPELLRDLANIHLLGLQKGDVHLVTHEKMQKYHSAAIKEWIEKNRSFLNTVMIYLFPNEQIPKPEHPEPVAEIEIPDELKEKLNRLHFPAETVENVDDTPRPQLSEEDMSQINALVAADMGVETIDVFKPQEQTPKDEASEKEAG